MSAELIATLSAFITLGIGMFAGFAWMVRRLDRVDDRLGTRIDKLDTRIDTLENKLGERIDALAGEVTDLKIAVARFEGPQRHLIQSR